MKEFVYGERVARHEPWFVPGLDVQPPQYWWGTVIRPCKKPGSYWVWWDSASREMGEPGKNLLHAYEVPVQDQGYWNYCQRSRVLRDEALAKYAPGPRVERTPARIIPFEKRKAARA